MTARIPENVSALLVDWSTASIMGNTMPPRDPKDDDDDDDDDHHADNAGVDAEPDEDLEPAAIREPDE